MSRLLIDENPILVLPTLAAKIGLNEAIFLQQLHYWLRQTQHWRDGRPWVYNKVAEWEKQFPFWSAPTIRRIVNNLREMGIVITTDKYNKMPIDKTLWYTIDYAKVPSDDFVTPSDQPDQSNDQLDQLERSDCAHVNDQSDHTNNQRLPENTTETTGREGASAPPPPDDAPPLGVVEYFDPRKLHNGRMPPGAGSTPIEVYLESFSISEMKRAGVAFDPTIKRKLEEEVADLERWRQAVSFWKFSGYRPGNWIGMLDRYHDGVQGRRSSSGAPPDQPEQSAGSNAVDRVFARFMQGGASE